VVWKANRANAVLAEAFGLLGDNMFPLRGGDKTVYHAANVVASNYLVSLLEVGLRDFEGGTREQAFRCIAAVSVRGGVSWSHDRPYVAGAKDSGSPTLSTCCPHNLVLVKQLGRDYLLESTAAPGNK
jgi:hypothetical protein